MDMRHINHESLAAMFAEMKQAAVVAAEAEGCTVQFEHIFRVPPMAFDSRLLDAARTSGLPFIPGVMTPSDVVAAREAGFDTLKLFPAQQAGGLRLLKALAGPFPDVLFCPTGGIDAQSAASFLELPNVGCVGGSWLAPAAAVDAGDWPAIESLARAACALRPGR
jgi:2-dehydro-3-deoxyphosphogluconate aldolase/(4S)-4-hydroxy-2-oxoglutarate aldolase